MHGNERLVLLNSWFWLFFHSMCDVVEIRNYEYDKYDVEKKLLSAYPGLEQFDRQEVPTENNFGLNFRVKEKTTAKGGLVGNTQTSSKK